MAASASDRFQKVGMSTATTLSAPGYTIGNTSITVASTTNWPTDTGVTFAIDEVETVDGQEVRVAGTYNIFRGTVASATSITNLTYVGGDANRNYSAGASTRVYILVSYAQMNRLIDGILVEHNQDGTHDEALITSRTEDTNPDPDADYLLSYDASATALKKVKMNNLAGSGTGWNANVLPAPDTVTYNGNRSYDLVFNSTDLTSTVSNGMRLKTTRTVAAHTQVTALSGTKYWSKATPNKFSFTDDWAFDVVIKPTSYALGTIVSCYNGTSGWAVRMNASGQIQVIGYNAGAANFSQNASYQSVPLNRETRISGQLDMSAFTNTSTTSYIMFDGVEVPSLVSRGGTNPTALVQAGNLNVGAENGGTNPFQGNISQLAIFSAKVTQATMRTYHGQTYSGSETNLASAYSFNGVATDLNTTTPNDLTAQNSAGYATGGTFGVNGTSSTIDYAVITANSFSTNTTLTVQVPEGCTIPTSGGVSAVAYSTQDCPYGFPRAKTKWQIIEKNKAGASKSTAASGTWINTGSNTGDFGNITIPTGSWNVTISTQIAASTTTSGPVSAQATLSSTNSTASNPEFTAMTADRGTISTSITAADMLTKSAPLDLTTATVYYRNLRTIDSNNSTLLLDSSSTTGCESSIVCDFNYV